MKTPVSTQNAQWLENRPMWKIDKQDPAKLRNPDRWLSVATYRMAPKMGWLDMVVVIRAQEIRNSVAKRK